jgi:hypothetical protein
LNGDVVAGNEIIDGQGNTLSVLAEALTKTASGNPVVISDCAGGKARSLITEINAIQDLHGYDKPWVGGAYKNKIDAADKILSEAGFIFEKEINTLAAGTYTLSFDCILASRKECQLIVKDGSTNVGSVTVSIPSGTSRASMTVTASASFNVATAYIAGAATISNIQLESGDTATSFAPYSNECPISGRTAAVVTRSDGDEISEDFTIQLGQTVYGGTANLVTGAARVTHAIVDMGDLGWIYSSANVRFQANMPSEYKTPASASERIDGLLCSCYEPNISPITGTHIDGTISGYEGSITIYVNDSTYTDAALFKTARTGQKILYKLATPIELTLTPTEVQMLKGYNRVTIDNGSIELGYIAKLT